MLSYLHEFHAGNHADILKHLTLLYVLEYLNKKNKPYSFFDTHSGAGIYNLKSEEALKTGEAERGIEKLSEVYKKNPRSVPNELKNYLDFVQKCKKNNFYPGSPFIEWREALKDAFICNTELHPKEFAKLSENLKKEEKAVLCQNIMIKNTSGWSILKSNVPPQIKRGAVLCDPSYEELSDYYNAGELLSSVHLKWSGATIMLWYPLLANKTDEIDSMKQQIIASVKNRDFHTEILDASLCIDSEDSHIETTLEASAGSLKPRLYGSGMLVVNPSWGLSEHLKACLSFITPVLQNENNGSYSVELF